MELIFAKKELAEMRLRKGFTLELLAAQCNLTKFTLHKIENGRSVRPSNAAKVCKALECEFDDIFQIGGK
ncbi:MAG: helix-turn-helix domain-containing protein [Bacteroidales bacterium]|nr:helix-turn-helix domain-containing protein [Bacteroidales bacterium]